MHGSHDYPAFFLRQELSPHGPYRALAGKAQDYQAADHRGSGDHPIGLGSAHTLAAQLRTLLPFLAQYDKVLRSTFDQHPDAELFRSVPGAGEAMAPRLLTAFGSDRARFENADALSTFSGIAPVTKSSGKSLSHHLRYACAKFLRQSFHEFAGASIPHCAWAKAFYESQRARNKAHHTAVRALAYKWIRILYACWKSRTPYNESRYLQSLKNRLAPIA